MRPISRTRLLPAASLAAASLIMTDIAYAELEEIIVTARKREEKLQDLPMSVTALDSETMNRLGINSLADVARFTPGVKLDTGFGLNDQRLVIRGLSPSRGRSNNAILVDGIDLTTESVSTPGGSMYFNSRLLDIERVEVVKGPQSALYGRAAFAGAIQYITKDPGEELESEAGIDIGEDGRRYYRAALGGPINDELGIRINGLSWNEDGHYDEGFTGASLGGGDGYGLSMTGKWAPSDLFTARARVSYSNDNYDQQATLYNPYNDFITDLPTSALALPNIDADTFVARFAGTPSDANGRTPYLTANPVNGKAYPGGELDALNTSLKLDWDVGYGTVSSYTGYVNGDSQQFLDGDFEVRPNAANTRDIARGGSEINFDADTRLLSQELRFASELDGQVQFTLGALYWDEKVDQRENALSALAFPFGPDGADPGYFNRVVRRTDQADNRVENNVSRDTNSQSIYGVIEWQFAEQWSVSFEGRFAREKMDVTGSGCDPTQPAATFRCPFSEPGLSAEFPPGSGEYRQLERVYTSDSTTDRYFAPSAIIDWAPTDDLLAYFSISQGIKPGGIATVASGTWMDQWQPDGNLDELKFEEEKLTAYELGAKTTWLERTLILNGAVFFQDYDDKQIPVQNIVDAFPFTTIDNAGEAEVWGLELDTTWLVTDNVRLQVGYAYLDTEYTKLEYITNSANSIARAGNCTPSDDLTVCSVSLSNNTMEDVPKHSIIALAGYYPPLFDTGLNGILEADVEWQDDRYIDEFNDRSLDAYSIVNMRIGVETEMWDALIYVNNVFDDDTIQSWSAGTGVVSTAERIDPNQTAFAPDGFSIAPAPRIWGMRANVRF